MFRIDMLNIVSRNELAFLKRSHVGVIRAIEAGGKYKLIAIISYLIAMLFAINFIINKLISISLKCVELSVNSEIGITSLAMKLSVLNLMPCYHYHIISLIPKARHHLSSVIKSLFEHFIRMHFKIYYQNI